MSSAAVFKLIANDGKADRMIMATALLRQRILDIYNSRKQAGKTDITPTLVDLERTHILYVNAHFKPFAAIGYEYTKIRPQSGSAQLGGGVTFSIPQYGDFFYDIVVRTVIEPARAKAYITPGTSVFYDATGELVADGAPKAVRNFVNYCEYPGYRLFNKVSFEVNGNPLDQYDTDTIVMLDKFTKPINKSLGSDKLVGQEVPLTGYTDVTTSRVIDNDITASGTINTPHGIGRWDPTQSSQQVALFTYNNGEPLNTTPYTLLQQNPSFTDYDNNVGVYVVGKSLTLNTFNANQTGSNVDSITYLNPGNTQDTSYQYNITRQQVNIVNGYQTPKPIQPTLEIWNKLRFWFNDDVRLAIPSVSIPFGQRFINIDLCQKDDLVFEYPSLYTFNTVGDQATTGQFSTYYMLGGLDEFDISNMEMFINNIFVNPEIHDIYIKRIGFSLIRVYRKQSSQQSLDKNEILLSNLKWPIEYMFVGFRPQFNTKPPGLGSTLGTSTGNWDMWHDWHRMTRQIPAYTTPSSIWGDVPDIGFVRGFIACPQGGQVKYWEPVPTIDTLGLVSHGIAIYDQLRDVFFNQYMPYQYGGWNVNTPTDEGAFMINMSLYPRSYQPSGHINISRARETYINYTSTYISSNTPCQMICIAVAINFLLITDGSAILRYST